MAGLHDAYTHTDAKGEERIYLNADWLASANAAAGVDAIEAVLLEELGHALDWRINGSNDSAGDDEVLGFHSLICLVLRWIV